MRRFGKPPISGKTYVRRPGAYAILPKGGDLLLTFQAGESWEFQLPGGGIDPGENPISALHREVGEETGWRISPLRKLTTYQRYVYMPEYDLWAKKICHIYLGRPIQRLSEPTEDQHTAVWLPASEALSALANEADRVVLRQLLA